MNREIIEENIIELENSDTTFENVQELAYLYIIRERLFNVEDSTEKELSDLFPAYEKYLNTKRNYQLKHSDDEQMIYYFGLVCDELSDFIQSLYSGTDTRKQRQIIIDLLSNLLSNFSK